MCYVVDDRLSHGSADISEDLSNVSAAGASWVDEVIRLDELIRSHDVIYALTDSREARCVDDNPALGISSDNTCSFTRCSMIFVIDGCQR